MNIPREHSVCQNVVVVGGPGDVARAGPSGQQEKLSVDGSCPSGAKDYIDNVLWKAQNQPTGVPEGLRASQLPSM